jgi:hypothetical protein
MTSAYSSRLSIAAAVVVLSSGTAWGESAAPPDAATTYVSNVAELQAAFAAAQAGDIIELAPGTYAIDQSLVTGNPGDAFERIIVRSGGSGIAVLESTLAETIHVTQPFWGFEYLEIRGVCPDDSTCEHAFHITGNADSTRVRNCVMRDFNAQIKGNGDTVGAGGVRVWPDDVEISHNEIYDTRSRQTANPVTKIDVVGGRRWLISDNDIHDFEKAGGDMISYAAFLKGNSRDGVMRNNKVVCSLGFTGGVRIGLSLGGGGSGPDPICEDGTCTPEHQNGVIHDNLIAHCSDVGIYLNEARSTEIYHNTIYDTAGVDVRFAESTANLRNNLIGGVLRDRDGGAHIDRVNLIGIAPADWQAWFVDPDALNFGLTSGGAVVDAGEVIPGIITDYCYNDRDDGDPDLGAVEYDDDVMDIGVMCVLRNPPVGVDAGDPTVPPNGAGCCSASADPTGSLLLVGLVGLLARRSRRLCGPTTRARGRGAGSRRRCWRRTG